MNAINTTFCKTKIKRVSLSLLPDCWQAQSLYLGIMLNIFSPVLYLGLELASLTWGKVRRVGSGKSQSITKAPRGAREEAQGGSAGLGAAAAPRVGPLGAAMPAGEAAEEPAGPCR